MNGSIERCANSMDRLWVGGRIQTDRREGHRTVRGERVEDRFVFGQALEKVIK